MNDINKRVDPKVVVSDEFYLSSLLNLCESLSNNLKEYLELEGRFSGLARSYMNSIWETLSYTNEVLEDGELEIFEKVIYLLKPSIIREFNYLLSKRLSQGDAVIVIMKKILEVMIEKATPDWEYTKKTKTILKLINKFYENIRNNKKSAKLFNLSNSLKYCIEKSLVGKYPLPKITFPDKEKNKARREEILDNPGERISEEIDNKVSEVSWTEEL